MTQETLPLGQSDRLPSVTITTDGGCEPNPGVGGWAAILEFNGRRKEISGGEAQTTNNRMELQAVAEALEALKVKCRVHVRTDSVVVLGLLNGTGMKPHKRANQDLVQRIIAAMRNHEVSAEWVKGHNGDPENERADQLAGEWIAKLTAEKAQ